MLYIQILMKSQSYSCLHILYTKDRRHDKFNVKIYDGSKWFMKEAEAVWRSSA